MIIQIPLSIYKSEINKSKPNILFTKIMENFSFQTSEQQFKARNRYIRSKNQYLQRAYVHKIKVRIGLGLSMWRINGKRRNTLTSKSKNSCCQHQFSFAFFSFASRFFSSFSALSVSGNKNLVTLGCLWRASSWYKRRIKVRFVLLV